MSQDRCSVTVAPRPWPLSVASDHKPGPLPCDLQPQTVGLGSPSLDCCPPIRPYDLHSRTVAPRPLLCDCCPKTRCHTTSVHRPSSQDRGSASLVLDQAYHLRMTSAPGPWPSKRRHSIVALRLLSMTAGPRSGPMTSTPGPLPSAVAPDLCPKTVGR